MGICNLSSNTYRVEEQAIHLDPNDATEAKKKKTKGEVVSDLISNQLLKKLNWVTWFAIFVAVSIVLFNSDLMNPGRPDQEQLVLELSKPFFVPILQAGPKTQNWTKFGKKNECFKVLEGSFRFTECHWQCVQQRAVPASIHSDQENNFIFGLFDELVGITHWEIKKNAWFGLAKINKIWTNLDGSSLNYQNWAEDEPNNEDHAQFCGQLYTSNSRRGNWNDHRCNEQLDFCVCKSFGENCG